MPGTAPAGEAGPSEKSLFDRAVVLPLLDEGREAGCLSAGAIIEALSDIEDSHAIPARQEEEAERIVGLVLAEG